MSNRMDEIAKAREQFEEAWIDHLRVLNDYEIGECAVDDFEKAVHALTDAKLDLECAERPVM